MDANTIAIACQVARELCELQREPDAPKSGSSTSLVFPSYRSGTSEAPPRARISEAEARILYCLALSAQGIPFAVEAPTSWQYTFSGATEVSARTDLAVYAAQPGPPTTFVRDLAIEFKAHNPRVEAIRKDLEKLVREPYDGLWFHVLTNADSKTIRVLMAKFAQAIENLGHLWRECEHSLTVCLAVLERKCWLYRTLVPAGEPAPDLSIDYEIRSKKLVVKDPRAWKSEDF